MTIRVCIVDDHPMVTEGIQSILESYDDIEVAGTLTNGQDAVDQVQALAPDVMLLDLNMPGISGLNATEMILEKRPETRILILSMHDSPEYISTALSHGAKGYILKDVPTEEIRTAIDTVMGGGAIPLHRSQRIARPKNRGRARTAHQPRADDPAGTGPRQIQQAGRRHTRHLRPHGGDPPQQHQTQTRHQQHRRPHPLRDGTRGFAGDWDLG